MRVQGKGTTLDRSKTVRFTFDGKQITGFQGDTVASALLGAGQRLMGRSFKYHRPRGPFTAGSAEPNALVTVGKGAEQTPNVRATVQEIYDGLEVRSQNAWPSLQWDAMSINDYGWRFLGAGFYYKTFMWPKPFWEKVYEPIIRKAAGLGALSGLPSHDTCESAYAHCDMLIVGAGPSGLSAALQAAESKAKVILIEESDSLGGSLLGTSETIDGILIEEWVAQARATLDASENVTIMTRTSVVGAYDQGTYAALERVSEHFASDDANLPTQCFWRIAAKRAILATGAMERPIAFPKNDRPGIMLASAMGTYLHRYGVTAGKKLALFGNNDSIHRTALDLLAAGFEPTVIDIRTDAKTLGDYTLHAGSEIIGTTGNTQGLTDLTIRTGDDITRLPCDGLGVSGGWNPNVALTCHQNARPVWNADIHAFVPSDNAVPGMTVAGAACGVYGTQQAMQSGADQARLALQDLGYELGAIQLPKASSTTDAIKPIWAVDVKGRAWLDFQNDVTTKDVKQAAQENYRSVEHMKRYTTQGMATDQGKNSNILALAILADATGRTIPETGTTTFRAPYTPVAIEAMGAGAKGKGFAPERITTSHKAAKALRAPFIEAGLWHRPSYMPREGELTWRDACDREVLMTRASVGVVDVSTLGKIDVQGPDASKLLDFVYTNMFSTLKVGKVRYGAMLREDGHVMDDGTTARLAEHHYVMTTTTVAAGQVMRHLEFVTQVLHPEWDVQVISTTEAWAQFSLAGPKARDLLNQVLDTPVDNETLPYMGCLEATLHGVAGRVFRISFSGEHAYEVAVPARYGASLFRDLVARAESLGGGAYGMEALNVMRIEKGFVTHSEINGQKTMYDIGMERMISAKKDCIGKDAAKRPGLLEGREELVGVKPVVASQQIDAGAHLFAMGAEATREEDQGYLSSACYSPTLASFIALGFLKNGRARLGEKMQLVDHLRNSRLEVEICDPIFVDPEGTRVRG